MANSRLRRVSAQQLQRIFNTQRYHERAESGEFTQIVQVRRPAPPALREVPGTESQIVHYIDRGGNTVAIVHQYERPDGTLAASGRPDPKFLFHNGVRYQLLRIH
jgi:hypothetical protein